MVFTQIVNCSFKGWFYVFITFLPRGSERTDISSMLGVEHVYVCLTIKLT